MPITIKKTIKIHISNSYNNNKVVSSQKEAEKKFNEAERVTIRTKTTTQKYNKG